jgi:succinate-acetate transporter protein
MGLFKLILPDSSGNIMLPVALFFGGCTQFLAGLLCLLQGKSWGGSLFMSWGAYWIGAAIRMVPNISSAFDAYTDPYDLDTANGIYFFIWAIYGFMVSLISIRIKGGNMLTTYNMFFIALNLLTEGIYNITHATSSMRVSGVASLLAAAGAYYGAVVDIFAEQGVKYWVGEYKHDDDN